jgi:HTH-type transcriptional regulator, fmd operon transcriptional regulator
MWLTEKEIEVLELKKKGILQKDIAKKLKISPAAVSTFYKNAVDKIKKSKETIQFVKEKEYK